jgi:hypothetical protein
MCEPWGWVGCHAKGDVRVVFLAGKCNAEKSQETRQQDHSLHSVFDARAKNRDISPRVEFACPLDTSKSFVY